MTGREPGGQKRDNLSDTFWATTELAALQDSSIQGGWNKGKRQNEKGDGWGYSSYSSRNSGRSLEVRCSPKAAKEGCGAYRDSQ